MQWTGKMVKHPNKCAGGQGGTMLLAGKSLLTAPSSPTEGWSTSCMVTKDRGINLLDGTDRTTQVVTAWHPRICMSCLGFHVHRRKPGGKKLKYRKTGQLVNVMVRAIRPLLPSWPFSTEQSTTMTTPFNCACTVSSTQIQHGDWASQYYTGYYLIDVPG